MGNTSPRVVGTLITENSENTNLMTVEEIGRINTNPSRSSASEELMFPLFVQQKDLAVKLAGLEP